MQILGLVLRASHSLDNAIDVDTVV